MDLVVRCARLARPGETIIAESVSEVPGGKGANQAVAAARMGADVAMIGRVGDDAFAARLVENLQRHKIDITRVSASRDCASGLAIVAVQSNGENSIVVVSGANGQLSVDDVASAADVIRASDALLLQLEVPLATVAAAATLARQAGVRVILDPAPAPAQFPEELLDVDLLCPNQSEAAAILGRPVESIDDARDAVIELKRRGAGDAVVTLGSRGAVVSDGGSATWLEPFTVEAVDTTAAGDAFAGALAVRWAEQPALIEAARFASAAGALAATRAGAQPGMPCRAEVDKLLERAR